jgi:hypothetical protein
MFKMIMMITMMILTSTEGFTNVPFSGRVNKNAPKSYSTSLNAWSLQRLGQPVGINVEVPTQQETETKFGDSVTTGTGIDERKIRHGKTDSESDWNLISDIDGYFKKQSLLASLESTSISAPEKLQRIQMAADNEGLLSNEFASVKPTALHSAGLMDDWDFETF